jgi:hypothetical protein
VCWDCKIFLHVETGIPTVAQLFNWDGGIDQDGGAFNEGAGEGPVNDPPNVGIDVVPCSPDDNNAAEGPVNDPPNVGLDVIPNNIKTELKMEVNDDHRDDKNGGVNVNDPLNAGFGVVLHDGNNAEVMNCGCDGACNCAARAVPDNIKNELKKEVNDGHLDDKNGGGIVNDPLNAGFDVVLHDGNNAAVNNCAQNHNSEIKEEVVVKRESLVNDNIKIELKEEVIEERHVYDISGLFNAVYVIIDSDDSDNDVEFIG